MSCYLFLKKFTALLEKFYIKCFDHPFIYLQGCIVDALRDQMVD